MVSNSWRSCRRPASGPPRWRTPFAKPTRPWPIFAPAASKAPLYCCPDIQPPFVHKTARDLPPELTRLAGLTSVVVVQQLQSDTSGLTEIETSRRRDLHGSNTIAHEQSKSLLLILALVS